MYISEHVSILYLTKFASISNIISKIKSNEIMHYAFKQSEIIMQVQDFTGQSTNETCLSNFILLFSNPGTSHIGLSSFPLP